MTIGRTVAAASVALMLVALYGCSPKFTPVSLGLDTDPPVVPDRGFLNVLLDHLADRRDVAFARALRHGSYQYLGAKSADRDRVLVYLFKAVDVRYSPMSFVYLKFGAAPYMTARANMSIFDRSEGVTEESDGSEYRGLYRLTVMDAALCVGDTRDYPVVKDTDIVVVPVVKEHLRRHLYDMFLEFYTQPFCEGKYMKPTTNPIPEDLKGVHFYFDDPQSMRIFAQSLRAAFPHIKIEDRSGRAQPAAK